MSLRKLVIAIEARQGLFAIAAQIASNFGKARSNTYRAELKQYLKTLKQSPAIFPSLASPIGSLVYKAVFRKLTIIIYRYDEQNVYIDAILDARSDWKA